MSNGQADDTDVAPDWGSIPRMDKADFHDKGGQAWRYDEGGVYLRGDPNTPLRSKGKPATILAILAAYGTEIRKAAVAHQIPPELIVMTIAAETAIYRPAGFTGPKTFRWEAHHGTYSGGPMQVLETTARDIIKRLKLKYPASDIPPHFESKPQQPPSMNPLYDGEVNIDLGTGYLKLNKSRTGLDPILMAACYNHGSVAACPATQQNPWALFTAGDHLNRAAAWFGDACAVISALRNGGALDVDDLIAAPAEIDAEDEAREELELRGLTREIADREKADYEDSGATVIEFPEEGGLFTLVITYDKPVAIPESPPPPPIPNLKVQPPEQDGYVICIDRKASQKRSNKEFPRTVGLYQAFFNKKSIPNMCGTAVERQGPGDNTQKGVRRHARLTQGTYPLFTHAGANSKYRTYGFANPGGLKSRPWPSIRIGGTGARSGVLIHCAAGYLMSIGCINLTGRRLAQAAEDIEFFDSRSRVIDLIKNMRAHLGNRFPDSNNAKIKDALLVIRGEP